MADPSKYLPVEQSAKKLLLILAVLAAAYFVLVRRK